MNDTYSYRDIKKILLTTLDGLDEREMFLKELHTMEIKAAYYKAMFYSKKELALKLSQQVTKNSVNDAFFKSLIQMRHDEDITDDEYKFCCELYAPKPIL